MQGSTIEAPGSGNVYRIYTRGPAHKGRGSLGKKTNSPVGDTGTLPRTLHKPSVPVGISPGKMYDTTQHQIAVGTAAAERLIAANEDLRNVLANPDATEDLIADKIKAGVAAGHAAAVLGSDGDAASTALMREVGEGLDRIGDKRNSAFEAALNREERQPGSLSEADLKKHVHRVLEIEKQRELLGAADDKAPPIAMQLVSRGLGIAARNKSNAVRTLLDQEKRSAGSVPEARLSTAISELLGTVKQCQILGISGPGVDDAMPMVGEAVQVWVKRKADARRKLLQQKQIPGSVVTDQQIQRATDDLTKAIEQARLMGVSVPDL